MKENLFNICLRILHKRNSGFPLETWESQTLRSLVEDGRMPVEPSHEFPPKYFPEYTYPNKSVKVQNLNGTIYSRRLADIKDPSHYKDLDQYSDVMPRNSGESDSAYRARIQNDLLERLKMSFRNLDQNNLASINYNSAPGSNIFSYKGNNDNLYSRMRNGKLAYGGPREFTTLDIETDDWGRPITISALKQVYNKETGRFETVDSYQRFYNAKNRDLIRTYDTHGLTRAALKKLRTQQGLKYATSYNDKEEMSLKDFLGSSVVMGHNIVEFDLPHLFHEPIYNQTIDTLIGARNQWKDKKNGLDDVFKRIFGVSMEQAGLSHHDSMSDTIATAMIAQEMLKMNSDTGKAMRYVATHPNVHMAPYESMLESQIIKGRYNGFQNVDNYITGADMGKIKDLDGDTIKDMMSGPAGAPENDYDYDVDEFGHKSKVPSGMDYDYPESNLAGEDIIMSLRSMQEVAKYLDGAAKNVGATYQEFIKRQLAGNIYGKSRELRYAAGLNSDEDRRKYFELQGFESSGIEMLVNKSRELREIIDHNKDPSIALKKLSWGASRRGETAFANRFMDLAENPNADPFDIWEAQQDWKDRLKEIRESETDDRKHDTEWKNFYKDKHSIVDKYLRYGYSKEDIEGISSATDNDELTQALEDFKFEQRKQHEMRVASRNGDYEKMQRISETQTELDLDKLDDSFVKATNSVQTFGQVALDVAAKLNNLPTESYQNVIKMTQSEMSGIFGASQGVIPSLVTKPFQRFSNAAINFMRSDYAKIQYGWDTLHYIEKAAPIVGSAIGAGVGSIAGGVGAIPGAAIGSGIGTAAAGLGNLFESVVTYFPNKRREKILTEFGEAAQGRLNLLGGYVDIVSTPFKLLGSAAKFLTRNFLTLGRSMKGVISGGLNDYNNMGSPLTPLTGVGYGAFEDTRYIDTITNVKSGTTNGAYESFSQAQQNLYWGGRFDQNRLTAAALLGVYGDVYANGGDTSKQYARVVNTLFNNMQANPTQRQFILGQATQIDSQLPQILSYMERASRYLGRNVTYEDMQRAGTWGVYKRDLTDAEADRFYGYRTERGIISDSISNTKMRFAGLMWNAFGRDIMNSLNEVLDHMYVAFSQSKFLSGMRELADDIKNQKWDEVWGDVKGITSIAVGYIKKALDQIKGSIKISFSTEGLRNTITKGIMFINDAWWTLISGMTESLSGLIDYVNTIRINPQEVIKAIQGKPHDRILTMGYDTATTYKKGTYNKVKGYSWFDSNLTYGGVPRDPNALALLNGLYNDEITILGQALPREFFRQGNTNYYRGFDGSRTSALQTLMDVAASNNWDDPYKAVGWLTSLEGRDTYNTLFSEEQQKAIEEAYQPKWLKNVLATMEQLRGETDLNIGNVVDKLITALTTGFKIDLNVQNDINLDVSGDAKKVSENKGVIPNLLSFTINGQSTAGYAGNLVQKLTAASTGGQ